eukprot:8404661-Alexandrium_andersonii.AAC.1
MLARRRSAPSSLVRPGSCHSASDSSRCSSSQTGRRVRSAVRRPPSGVPFGRHDVPIPGLICEWNAACSAPCSLHSFPSRSPRTEYSDLLLILGLLRLAILVFGLLALRA